MSSYQQNITQLEQKIKALNNQLKECKTKIELFEKASILSLNPIKNTIKKDLKKNFLRKYTSFNRAFKEMMNYSTLDMSSLRAFLKNHLDFDESALNLDQILKYQNELLKELNKENLPQLKNWIQALSILYLLTKENGDF
jgi:hypothetical protein